MGTFDPSVFLDATLTAANDTKLVPVPPGEYNAIIEGVEFKPWTKKDGSASGIKLAMKLNIDDEGVRQFLGREKVSVRYEVMIDVNEDSGTLDMGKGKNVGLGRLREATGLNVEGQPFSPRMFEGKMVKARIDHRVDGENIYEDVKSVTRPQ